MTTIDRTGQTITVGPGEIDPSFVVTHRLPLSDAPRAYEMFPGKKENCEKVVLSAN